MRKRSVACSLVLLWVVAAGCGGRSSLGSTGLVVDAAIPDAEGTDGSAVQDGTGPPDAPIGCDATGSCPPTTTTCGPQSCPSGCCDKQGSCRKGTSNGLCGTGGSQCQDCRPSHMACTTQQQCGAPPVCDAQTCPNGCCDSTGTCHSGTRDRFCGAGGVACQDCTATGSTCNGQMCASACPNGCTTCCDAAGHCLAGTADTQCGSTGTQCQDCTQSGQVCNFGSCAPPQPCPGTYPGCMPQPVLILTPQKVCPASTIQMIATACSTGVSSSATCLSVLQQLMGQNTACASCLSYFTFDFVPPDGVYECATPYVSAMCGQQAQCYLDCLNSVCQGCGGATLPACLTQSGPAVCAAYAQGNACIDAALMGPAALCNPANYGNWGAWFTAVGTAYCAM